MADTTTPSLPALIRWLTGITRPVHGPLAISTLLRIANLSLEILLFGLAGAGVASVISRDSSPVPILLGLAVIALLKAGAYYAEQFSGHYVAFKALELLRTHVFAELWPKAPGIVTRTRSGDVLTSLTRDVDRIEVVYAHTFAPVVSAYIVPPVALILTGALGGWDLVAVPALCVALGLLVVPFAGLRSAMAHTRTTLELRRNLSHHISDSVFGTEEVVGYGRQAQRLEEAGQQADAIADSASVPMHVAALRRGANLALGVMSAIGAAAAGVAGGHSLVATAAVAAGALRLFVGPQGVEDAAGYLDHSLAAARRLWDICHAPNLVEDGPQVLDLSAAPSVSFEKVSYTYGEREGADAALADVSVDIPAGTRTVFVGPSGSGKSTAVHLLLRYDDPSVGAVKIDGVDVREYTLDSLRHAVVSVAQDNQLLNESIGVNVRLGAPDASDDEVWAALDAAGIGEEIRAMPEGLQTNVGQGGSQLSGGQAQRICLARALLMRPRVLVLDEFTASLNSELEQEIRQRIARALPDATVLEVTHRLESAEDADQVVLLDRGRTVFVGSPQQMVASAGSVADFFRGR